MPNLFTWVNGFKAVCAIVFVALIVGMVGSCSIKSKLDDVQEKRALKQTIKTSAKNIEISHKTNQSIEDRVAMGKAQAAAVKANAAKNAAKQKEQYRATTSKPPPALVHPDSQFDAGTVRLLDEARAGSTVGSPSVSDEESRTPSGVTAEQLIDNDLEVVNRYQELAARHNALVDYIEQKLRDQTKGR